MSSFHQFMERTKLPLIIVVLIPLLAILYVLFGADLPSYSPGAPTPTAAQPTSQQNTAPASLPQATISLTDASALPQQVAAAQFVPFSLTVQNPSNQSATYQYKISVHWSTGENDVIDVNTLSLTAGASKTIAEQLKFEIATETAQVSFQLPQTGQSLQFTIPRK